MSLQPAYSGAARGDRRARVMVVDDSAVARGLISRWVDEDPELMIAGKAANGLLAVQNAAKYAPDVVILDIEMPVMDGMAALPELLKSVPGVKVIMASTLTRRNAEISLRALSLGAIDYIPKPESNSGITRSASFREDLIRKIKAVCGMAEGGAGETQRAAPAPEGAVRERRAPPPRLAPDGGFRLRPFSAHRPRVLAIGASTGGPKALADLFTAIAPAIGSVPVLVTQHMPATFTTILAEHLARITGGRCREAEHGEPLRPGAVYVAPGGFHMALQGQGEAVRLNVFDGPQVNYCKPAIDPMFQSAGALFGASALALVLTGMGHDGRHGALDIANAGGSVIAQDQATSVVWGMPQAALAAGACAAALPLGELGRKVSRLLQGEGAR